jgi:hypothetical protein
MGNTDKHLHILARKSRDLASETLSGDTRRLTARDVRMAFDGTPYGDQPGLVAVLASKVDVGYAIPPDAGGWVCVTACAGVDKEQCAETLAAAAVGGDVRMQKAIAHNDG